MIIKASPAASPFTPSTTTPPREEVSMTTTKFEVIEGQRDPEELDLESLRLDPSVTEGMAAKVPISIPVHRPSKHDWVRVHPRDSLPVAAIDLKEERDGIYLIETAMAAALGAELVQFVLHPCINRLGVLRLWPVRLPAPDGRQNEWHRSAAIAAAMAQKHWVRVVPNQNLGGYEVFQATAPIPDPIWPELTLRQMLKIAFQDRGRIIRDFDHPVVRLLQGRL
jgi:hypothetical protein